VTSRVVRHRSLDNLLASVADALETDINENIQSFDTGMQGRRSPRSQQLQQEDTQFDNYERLVRMGGKPGILNQSELKFGTGRQSIETTLCQPMNEDFDGQYERSECAGGEQQEFGMQSEFHPRPVLKDYPDDVDIDDMFSDGLLAQLEDINRALTLEISHDDDATYEGRLKAANLLGPLSPTIPATSPAVSPSTYPTWQTEKTHRTFDEGKYERLAHDAGRQDFDNDIFYDENEDVDGYEHLVLARGNSDELSDVSTIPEDEHDLGFEGLVREGVEIEDNGYEYFVRMEALQKPALSDILEDDGHSTAGTESSAGTGSMPGAEATRLRGHVDGFLMSLSNSAKTVANAKDIAQTSRSSNNPNQVCTPEEMRMEGFGFASLTQSTDQDEYTRLVAGSGLPLETLMSAPSGFNQETRRRKVAGMAAVDKERVIQSDTYNDSLDYEEEDSLEYLQYNSGVPDAEIMRAPCQFSDSLRSIPENVMNISADSLEPTCDKSFASSSMSEDSLCETYSQQVTYEQSASATHHILAHRHLMAPRVDSSFTDDSLEGEALCSDSQNKARRKETEQTPTGELAGFRYPADGSFSLHNHEQLTQSFIKDKDVPSERGLKGEKVSMCEMGSTGYDRGEKGSADEKGSAGKNGSTCQKGSMSENGSTCENGSTSEKGATGKEGSTNEKGPTNENGSTSDTGATGARSRYVSTGSSNKQTRARIWRSK